MKGPYLLDDSLSIADLKLYTLGVIRSSFMENIPTNCADAFANAMATFRAVEELDKVKEWNAAH